MRRLPATFPMVFLCLSVLNFNPAGAETCDWNCITDDSAVWLANPVQNYDAFQTLGVGSEAGDAWRSYVRFDLSCCLSPGAIIESATLTMRPNGAMNSANYQIDVYKTAGPWTEESLTWSNQPGGTVLLASDDCSGLSDRVNFDVTSAVQDWFNTPSSNHGFYIRGSNEATTTVYFFPTKEDAGWLDRVPRLEVVVAAPPNCTLRGTVRDDHTPSNGRIANVMVSLDPPAVPPVTTGPDGKYEFCSLPAGSYQVTFDHLDGIYASEVFEATVTEDSPTIASAYLQSRAVILVHGLCSTSADWSDWTAPLTDAGFTVFADLDLFPNTAGVVELSETLDAYVSLKQATKNFHSFSIVSHSMGGLVSRTYMVSNPGQVKRLVMLATPNHGSSLAPLAGGLAEALLYLESQPDNSWVDEAWESLLQLLFDTFLTCDDIPEEHAFFDLAPGSPLLNWLNFGFELSTEEDPCSPPRGERPGDPNAILNSLGTTAVPDTFSVFACASDLVVENESMRLDPASWCLVDNDPGVGCDGWHTQANNFSCVGSEVLQILDTGALPPGCDPPQAFTDRNDDGPVSAPFLRGSIGEPALITAQLSVAPSGCDPIFSEHWESGIDSSKWTVYGTPAPILVAGEGVSGSTAMDSNGDAGCQSGMWAVDPIPWGPGSRMRVAFRTDITGQGRVNNHQNIQIGLCSGWDTGSCGSSNQGVYPELYAFVGIAQEGGNGEKIQFGRPGIGELIPAIPYPASEDGIWHSIEMRVLVDNRIEFWYDDVLQGTSVPLDISVPVYPFVDGRSNGPQSHVVDDFVFDCPPSMLARAEPDSVWISQGNRAVFLSLGDVPPADYYLVDPLGAVIDSAAAETNPDVTYHSAGGAATFEIITPEVGAWLVTNTPGGSSPRLIAVYEDGGASLANLTKARSNPGTPLTVLAQFSDGVGPIVGATVEAIVADPAGTVSTLTLLDDGLNGDGAGGDGVYGLAFTGTGLSGTYALALSARSNDAVPLLGTTGGSVLITALPDLAVTTGDIAFSNPTPAYGDTVTVDITVHNLGDADADSVRVEVSDNGLGAVFHTEVVAVTAASSTALQATWLPDAPPNEHEVTVLLSRLGEPLESSMDNNIATSSIHVSGPSAVPDLDGPEASDQSAPPEVWLQVQPNPFPGTTELLLRLDRPVHAVVEVFDSAGRLVARPLVGAAEPGLHRTTWRGLDSSGRRLPAGVYLYRLRLNGHVQANGRLVILR